LRFGASHLRVGLILSCFSASAFADPWSLTDSSLSPASVDSVTISDTGVTGSLANGKKMSVPLDGFVSLVQGRSSPVPAGSFVIHTSTGERLVGLPVTSTTDSLTWETKTVGTRTVPLASVIAITRSTDAPAGEAPQEDVANVSSVRFASTGGGGKPKSDAAAPFVVGLIDGTLVRATAVKADAAGWTLSIGGADPVRISTAQVVRLDHVAGPVLWLSALTPTTVTYMPYLGENYPPVTDATVSHEPIRYGDRTYDRGIGVHARTTLTYDLDGAHPTFRARYATDPTMPLADVVVRVRVDDKVVHEAKVKGGALSDVVWADLTGAKTLSLEVDFGAGLHAQDRLNWVETALLKSPVPTTSTTPTNP
jgi:hypothetical protein